MHIRDDIDLFVPDGLGVPAALSRVTHLGIGAHPDDLEFMALQGIEACHASNDLWFGGVVVTDGARSARAGAYAETSDAEMRSIRAEEQREAARIGRYGFVAQMGYPSADLRRAGGREPVVADLVSLLKAARPGVIHTHNPFDKHPTHVGVMKAVLQAVQRLDPADRPARIFGCEGWRGLDWLPDAVKVVQPVGRCPGLGERLAAAFRSQIGGGKRYDRAVEGRYRANATFADPHAVDESEAAAYAIDLTVLTLPEGPGLDEYVESVLDRFSSTILRGIAEVD